MIDYFGLLGLFRAFSARFLLSYLFQGRCPLAITSHAVGVKTTPSLLTKHHVLANAGLLPAARDQSVLRTLCGQDVRAPATSLTLLARLT